MSAPQRPRLCIVGPMVGRNPGQVTTQGERLADLFRATGFRVIEVSGLRNRYLRLADIIQTLVRRRREFDIVVLQVFSGPSFVVEDIASWIAKRLGRKVVMVLRGGGMPVFMSDWPGWTRRVLDRAHTLVTPSAFLARSVKPMGYHAEVIPNVIDLSAYPYRLRRTLAPKVLWMRSFHSLYNPELALRVFARVKEQVPAATLVMGGSDLGLEASTRRMAEELGLANAIRFVGFLDMQGKQREFAAADLFINTNRVDNMPVSVIEACACGLPVVATRVGGVSDLLTDGRTALLVRSDDDRAMAAGVIRLLNDPDLAARLSDQGRELAMSSSVGRVMPQWQRLLGRVAGAAFGER